MPAWATACARVVARELLVERNSADTSTNAAVSITVSSGSTSIEVGRMNPRRRSALMVPEDDVAVDPEEQRRGAARGGIVTLRVEQHPQPEDRVHGGRRRGAQRQHRAHQELEPGRGVER